jgi:hypothetical protein
MVLERGPQLVRDGARAGRGPVLLEQVERNRRALIDGLSTQRRGRRRRTCGPAVDGRPRMPLTTPRPRPHPLDHGALPWLPDTPRHRSAHAPQPQLPGSIVSRSACNGRLHAIVKSRYKSGRSSFRTLRGRAFPESRTHIDAVKMSRPVGCLR